MLLAAGVVLAVTAAVIAATSPAGDRTALLLPVAAVLMIGAGVLAFARFELFLFLVILGRASFDIAKLGSTSVDATGALSVLFIAAALVWVTRRYRSIDLRPIDRVVLPLAAFFVAGLLSVAFSKHPLDSALEAVRIGTVVVIVVTLAMVVTDARRVRWLLLAVFGSTLVPLAFAVRQLAGGSGLITFEGFGRIRGTFLHPNPFATYLFMIVVLGVALLPHVRTRWRVPLALLIVTSGGVLVLTYARGAWIAAVIGLVVVGILQSRWVLWLLAAGLITVWLAVPSVGIRLSDLGETVRPSGAPGNSLAWRLGYWDRVLDLQENPMLGIGLREVELTEEAEKAPHNDFIRVYVEMGIIGLLTYLWLLGSLFVEARAALRRAPPGVPHGLAIGFLAILVGLVVLSTVANVISQLVILWYFAAIVVAAIVASRATPAVATSDA